MGSCSCEQGVIDVEAVKPCGAQLGAAYPHSFKVIKAGVGTEFFFSAASADEMKKWVEAVELGAQSKGYSSDEYVVLRGYLGKMKEGKGWKRRWCVLQGQTLSWWKSDTAKSPQVRVCWGGGACVFGAHLGVNAG
jgi:hypothetical protein